MARILFVSARGHLGGAERSLLLLVPHVCKHHDVSVACPLDGGLAQELVHTRCRIFPLPDQRGGLSHRWRYGLWLLQAATRVDAIAGRVRPALVHANTVYAAMTALLATLPGRRPLLWHARDCLATAWPARICGRIAQRVIAVSHAVKRHHVDQGLEAGSIQVIYNGVAEGVEARSRAARGRAGGRLTFANIGQFVPWKRQSVFIEAAGRVAAVMPEARFWLVGDRGVGSSPGYGEVLRKCAASHCPSHQVEFIPWQRDLREVWDSIDCLVHTAVGEPFGRVVIEAMARGIPVIAADSGGPSEIIVPGSTGLLVPPGDVEALAGAMLRMASDPEAAADMGARGRQVACTQFSAQRTAEQVLEVYADVLRGR